MHFQYYYKIVVAIVTHPYLITADSARASRLRALPLLCVTKYSRAIINVIQRKLNMIPIYRTHRNPSMELLKCNDFCRMRCIPHTIVANQLIRFDMSVLAHFFASHAHTHTRITHAGACTKTHK